MNVNLHIGSIVLDGIELAPGDDQLLQQVISRELTTLFASEGLSSSHRSDSEVDSVSAGTIRLGATGYPSLGQQLAHSIHGGVYSATSSPTGGPK